MCLPRPHTGDVAESGPDQCGLCLHGSRTPKVYRSCFGSQCAPYAESSPPPTPYNYILNIFERTFLLQGWTQLLSPPSWGLFWLSLWKWFFYLWTSMMLYLNLVWPLNIFCLVVLWLFMFITSLIAAVGSLEWMSYLYRTSGQSATCIICIPEMYLMQMDMWMTWSSWNKDKLNANREQQMQSYEG